MKTFILENDSIKAVCIAYGAILHQLWVKDIHGVPTNVIMGLATPEEYLTDKWAQGAVIGRFAGRLVNPIQVGGQSITIENENGVMLHSGKSGWHLKNWTPKYTLEQNTITFEYDCPEGSSGFPGSVHAHVTYTLKTNGLEIQYQAKPSATTPINMTNHAYFSMNPNTPIGKQKLFIHADHYLELQNLVPTGRKLDVGLTPLDFRNEKNIDNTPLDDYFVIKKMNHFISSIYSPDTGIQMKVYTDQPGVVVFTPPHFDAICFETQKFSNYPNIPDFPSTIVEANQEYNHSSFFEFSLRIEG